ncbi:MAG: tyrosine-type recombinase/integrase [Syntrophales bacterium]|jgi:integrase
MGVKVKEKVEGSDVWWIFINHRGKRKAKKIGNDKRAAFEIARKIEARLTLGDMGLLDKEKEKSPAFKEYADRWISITVPATCKPSTMSSYEEILRVHVLPVFGSLPVSEINRLFIKEFLMKKKKESRTFKVNGKERKINGYSGSTLQHIKNAISGILNLAVDDAVINANPAHKLGKILRTKDLRLEVDPLTREELAVLLKTVKVHFPADYPFALTLARTGMRLGEVLGLQWGDIDFNGRFITVRRGISRGKIETPKNDKTRRVDMSRHLSETLLELRKQKRVENFQKGRGEGPEWVFASGTQKPLIAAHWRSRVFEKALAKAGLRKIRIHDLRHGYASMMIQAGESLAYIRDQLGHHSIKVTVDIYGHLAQEGNKRAVDRLDDATICIHT